MLFVFYDKIKVHDLPQNSPKNSQFMLARITDVRYRAKFIWYPGRAGRQGARTFFQEKKGGQGLFFKKKMGGQGLFLKKNKRGQVVFLIVNKGG